MRHRLNKGAARHAAGLQTARSDDRLRRLALLLAAAMGLLLVLPFVALALRAVDAAFAGRLLARQPIIDALLLSLGTTAVALVLTVALGTPLAYVLARYRFPCKRLLAVFVEMPIVMPPVVAGLALLAAFGRRGLVGAPLAALGINLTFSWLAVVLAQTFVSAPFFIRAAQSRFSALPRDLLEAASIDGAGGWQRFRRITLPLSQRALFAGMVLSWSRALGEFGATILFAGNLPGRTQTMPLLVYGALERDLDATYTTALILLLLAGTAIVLMRWLTRLDEEATDPLAE